MFFLCVLFFSRSSQSSWALTIMGYNLTKRGIPDLDTGLTRHANTDEFVSLRVSTFQSSHRKWTLSSDSRVSKKKNNNKTSVLQLYILRVKCFSIKVSLGSFRIISVFFSSHRGFLFFFLSHVGLGRLVCTIN